MATVTRTGVTSIDDATATTHAISGVTIAAGMLAVLRFGYQSDTVTITSVADDAGNTWAVATSVHSSSGDSQTGAIAYLVVPGGGLSGATVTITLSATSTCAADLTYFDSDAGWPSQAQVLDKVAAANTGLTVNWASAATATISSTNEILVGVAYSGGAINGGTSSPGSGWTEENEYALTHGYELITQWRTPSGLAGYQVFGTWSAAEIAACCIATFYTGDAVIPAYPVVEGTAETAVSTAGTSHAVTLPASIAAGETLLLIGDIGSTAATLNALAGWTELLDENAANGLKILYKKAAGGDSNPTFTSSASTRSAWIAYRISAADDPTVTPPEIGTTATGTSTAPDPPSLTPSGGSKDYLWIAFYGAAGEEADDDTWSDTPPSGFSPTPPRQKACGTVGTNLGGLIAAAELGATASSQNPGTFAKDVSAAWRAQTIAVYPAPAAAAAVIPDIVMAPPR